MPLPVDVSVIVPPVCEKSPEAFNVPTPDPRLMENVPFVIEKFPVRLIIGSPVLDVIVKLPPEMVRFPPIAKVGLVLAASLNDPVFVFVMVRLPLTVRKPPAWLRFPV